MSQACSRVPQELFCIHVQCSALPLHTWYVDLPSLLLESIRRPMLPKCQSLLHSLARSRSLTNTICCGSQSGLTLVTLLLGPESQATSNDSYLYLCLKPSWILSSRRIEATFLSPPLVDFIPGIWDGAQQREGTWLVNNR